MRVYLLLSRRKGLGGLFWGRVWYGMGLSLLGSFGAFSGVCWEFAGGFVVSGGGFDKSIVLGLASVVAVADAAGNKVTLGAIGDGSFGYLLVTMGRFCLSPFLLVLTWNKD